MNLKRVSQIKDGPFKAQTYYKWWHLKKYPQIFVKFAGALFVDLDRLAELIESKRGA